MGAILIGAVLVLPAVLLVDIYGIVPGQGRNDENKQDNFAIPTDNDTTS